MCFQHADGSGESCVDKSFGVRRRQQDGAAVLVLHHSSEMIQGDDSIAITNTAIIPPFVEVPRNHPFTTQGECISQSEAEAVVNAFAGAVPAISSVFHSHKDGLTAEDPSTLTEEACADAYNVAIGALQAAYGYDESNGGTILFKPTYTERPLTFRPTYQGALSYFIGSDCLDLVGKDIDQFPNADSEFHEAGFALNNADGSTGWSGADVSADFTYSTGGDNCHTAFAQGQICFEHADGSDKSCVDKTFAFNRRESDSAVVISLHHSSAIISEEASQVICQRGSLNGNECVEGTRKRNLRGN